MFLHTTHVKALPNHRLQLHFSNGAAGIVDLSQELWGSVFEPLKDESLFATARQCEVMGTVVWANGADFAPEFLLDLLHAQTLQAA
ncbi:MAG: DUF2442 domain-containing protein [Burkholderiaceae bacterium]